MESYAASNKAATVSNTASIAPVSNLTSSSTIMSKELAKKKRGRSRIDNLLMALENHRD